MKFGPLGVVQELPVEAQAAHLLVRHRLDHRDRHRVAEPAEVDARELGLLGRADWPAMVTMLAVPVPNHARPPGEVGRVETVHRDRGVTDA